MKQHWLRNLNEDAQDIVLQAWSKGTTKSYNVYLKQWSLYCQEHSIDMYNATINQGIDFLTFLFKSKNLGYSALNTARSALSLFIGKNYNIGTFGKQDTVSKLLKGMFRLRPSFPKYMVTYDPDIVLNHLKQIGHQIKMDLKLLTLKLTTLLCLLTGQRNQTIHSLDISCMHVDDKRIIFYIPTILKTTTPSSHLEPLELLRYQDWRLCVVTHIQLYIRATAKVRGSHNQLLLSYGGRHPIHPGVVRYDSQVGEGNVEMCGHRYHHVLHALNSFFIYISRKKERVGDTRYPQSGRVETWLHIWEILQ